MFLCNQQKLEEHQTKWFGVLCSIRHSAHFLFLFIVAALSVVFVVVFTRILCFVQIGSIFITVGFTCFNFLKSRVDRIVCTGMNNGYLLKIYYESYWRATERKEKWLNITMHKKGGKFICFFFYFTVANRHIHRFGASWNGYKPIMHKHQWCMQNDSWKSIHNSILSQK